MTSEAARSSIRGSGGAPSGPGLFLGVPIYPVPPGAPRGGTGAELGSGGGILTLLPRRRLARLLEGEVGVAHADLWLGVGLGVGLGSGWS